ncbi:hypothetical protein FVE85_8392 [Porphyridium purpureum]|uniref:Uncharacterized protein n=1 Tax=Porphyridium purpureum TaxID=35688 RepID=A0A5J4YLW2_PORPP|nr:hypothetical protein FVE85_8392 [Porphyridium purpureum]|eukprot:POR8427..scf244_11
MAAACVCACGITETHSKTVFVRNASAAITKECGCAWKEVVSRTNARIRLGQGTQGDSGRSAVLLQMSVWVPVQGRAVRRKLGHGFGPARTDCSRMMVFAWATVVGLMALGAVLVGVGGAQDLGTVDVHQLSAAQLNLFLTQIDDELHGFQSTAASLRETLATLQSELKATDKETEAMNGARAWEAAEKEKQLKEEQNMLKVAAEEQEKIAKGVLQIQELSREVAVMTEKYEQLQRRKQAASRKVYDPQILDMLDSAASSWGTGSQAVYNRTKELFDSGEVLRLYRKSMSRPVLVFLFSCMYGFVALCMYGIYLLFSRLRPTVAKLILVGDMSFAGFWLMVCTFFILLRHDPLHAMHSRAPRLFTVFQLTWLAAYVVHVLLRVSRLAARVSMFVFGELVSVIIVGNHYFVRVWQPYMMDNASHGSLRFYFCYLLLFTSFSLNSLQVLSPLKRQGSGNLGFVAWLKILYTRFTNQAVPYSDPVLTERATLDEDDAFGLFQNIRSD